LSELTVSNALEQFENRLFRAVNDIRAALPLSTNFFWVSCGSALDCCNLYGWPGVERLTQARDTFIAQSTSLGLS